MRPGSTPSTSCRLPEVPQLGERGGGWVVIQFTLIAAIAAAGVAGPAWPDRVGPWPAVAGVAFALAGAVVVVLSARALGSSLTPFPRPTGKAGFVAHGPYRVVRHPMYSGALLFLAGVSLLLSPWALVLTAALGVVWALKASVEERFLRVRHPGYAAYAERTRYRLVPFVY